MGLPAFMSSMSHSAVVGVGVSAVTVAAVSVYTIFRASSTPALRARAWARARSYPRSLRRASAPPRARTSTRGARMRAHAIRGTRFRSAVARAVSSKIPSTITPEWKRATIKYRAAQAQDPISNP